MTDITAGRPPAPATDGTAPDVTEPPLDTEEAERSADEALGLKLGTTTRTEIDDYTQLMRGQVALFASAVREGGGVAARGSWLEADQLLGRGPADDCLVFAAWTHVRDLARLLRRLVAEYGEQRAIRAQALPDRSCPAMPNEPVGDRCANPEPPDAPATEHAPAPVASER
ncbi:DUF6415 family natural product biosynthesis protein [Streptomyces griseus]|uniref:DUF6415 family natural product biosynthesis protein n=1 Tax=Streptomyces griseus TaxID=1911 RepID=UPI00067B9AF6|nr:DUF6415 family natural product biosynthesis protein [Streptomyces griseus]